MRQPDRERRESAQLLRSLDFCKFASAWLHVDAFLSRSGSSHFRYTLLPRSESSQQLRQMCFPMASFGHLSVQIWMGHFPRQVYHQKLMADVLGCCIWTPFCLDLDEAIFEPMYTLPKLLQNCFHMASFGHLSVPDLDQAHFRTKEHPLKAMFRIILVSLRTWVDRR